MTHTCALCGAENAAAQKFCGECGLALAVLCPNGHENPPPQKFCGECGAALASAPVTTSAGERRFVSVLFADLVGFTTFSEAHDHEEVRALVTRYFDRARDVITRFGGQVDKYIGDAITAFWGTTAAHEDDAERAVRAGLELVDSVAALREELDLPDLAVRVGVLSGETSVGPGGNEIGLVLGDIVNTAARLQSAAPPGSVLVGASTKRLTDRSISYVTHGSLDLKGKDDPVEAWRATTIASAVGGRRSRDAIEPPFVGRNDELRLLKDSVTAIARDRRARTVSVVGEAGIGKSRLVWEFQKYVDGLADTYYWHQGRSPAYGDGVTFWALGEMVRARCRISETEDPARARTRLRTTLAEFVTDEDEREWIELRLAGLLGLADVPQALAGEVPGAARILFQRLADHGPVILVFEDLHWADDAMLDFIDELGPTISSHPILAVTLARPDLLDRRPGWGSLRQHSVSVRLGPLSEPDMRSLVVGLLPDFEPTLVTDIVERSGGVPLYAVEFARLLMENGDRTELVIPDTLHSMVGARLDRLDPENRSMLQDAAILGQSFTVDDLQSISHRDDIEMRLTELVRLDLLTIETSPLSPERGQYRFVQSVIREVAYARIARRDRRERHLRVASHFAESASAEAAAVVAHHYMQAFEIEPDERLASEARGALVAAARRAIELGAPGQALGLARQAVDIPGDDGLLTALELAARSAAALLRRDEAVVFGRRALEWADEFGEDAQRARGATILGWALTDTNDPAAAAELLAPLFRPALGPGQIELGAELARAQMRSQRMEEAARTARAALLGAEREGNIRLVVELLNTRGVALSQIERTHEGTALLREALRLGEEHSLSYETWRAINNLVIGAVRDGESSIEALASRALALARRSMDLQMLTRAVNLNCGLAVANGDFATARALIEELPLEADTLEERQFAADLSRLDYIETGDESRLIEARGQNHDLIDDLTDPIYVAIGLDRLVVASWLLRDLDQMWANVAELERRGASWENFFDSWDCAIWAAIEEQNTDRLQRAADLVGKRAGRLFDLRRQTIEAGQQLMAGDERGVATLMSVADQIEAARGPYFAHVLRAVVATAAPSYPTAIEGARQAHTWFTEVGALGLVDRFAAAWAGLSGTS